MHLLKLKTEDCWSPRHQNTVPSYSPAQHPFFSFPQIERQELSVQ